MKCLQLSFLLSLLATSFASEAAECRDSADTCETSVRVNVTGELFGLIDDAPKEVFDAFVETSAGCLACVDSASLSPLGCGNKKDKRCKPNSCRGCLLPGKNKDNCDDACCSDVRMSAEEGSEMEFVYSINVCMDDLDPLDSSLRYVDYTDMLADFQAELEACYNDTTGFIDSWSTLLSSQGIDLSLMARHRDDGSSETIMFGMVEVDTEGATVTSYSSDESHRSTSHMIFYSALGFVTVSAFAVLGTAVVVRVLNKRKEEEKQKAAKWVSEMVNVDTANPLNDAAAASSGTDSTC